jgi:hypothetical protein
MYFHKQAGSGFESGSKIKVKVGSGSGKKFFGSTTLLKGTVSPVLSRLKVVWINTVESGEVPLVVYRFYISSVNL